MCTARRGPVGYAFSGVVGLRWIKSARGKVTEKRAKGWGLY